MSEYAFPDAQLNKALAVAASGIEVGCETGHEIGFTNGHMAVAFSVLSAQMLSEELDRGSAVQFLHGLAGQIERGETVATRVRTGSETMN